VDDAVDANPIPLRIVVQGFTDNLPCRAGCRYRDSWDLGLSRSIAVVRHMNWRRPESSVTWTAASSGELNPPFPNDNGQNRGRNRTVMLHISNAGTTSVD
jgi:flagellar motor protein MotB